MSSEAPVTWDELFSRLKNDFGVEIRLRQPFRNDDSVQIRELVREGRSAKVPDYRADEQMTPEVISNICRRLDIDHSELRMTNVDGDRVSVRAHDPYEKLN
jgi:hypothetical protein